MTTRNSKFTVLNGTETKRITEETNNYKDDIQLHTNPMYEKLLNFRNLQEAQKKRFSVDDLFKLC